MTKPIRRPRTDAAPSGAWRDRAACGSSDPELFFPVGTSPAAVRQAKRAKKVCAGCPVIGECLAWALQTRQDSGVWGGLSEEERRRIHRRRGSRAWTRGKSAASVIWNQRLDEYRALVADGLTPSEIADRLGTNVQTVNTVQERLDEEQAAAGQAVAA